MTQLKTRKNDASVEEYLDGIVDESRRRDCRRLLDIMRRITGEAPCMWGTSIVGFGSYHYRYESGREGEWFLTGFSARKQALTVYLMAGCVEREPWVDALGKCKTGKSCLYIKRLEDIHLPTLRRLIKKSVQRLTQG